MPTSRPSAAGTTRTAAAATLNARCDCPAHGLERVPGLVLGDRSTDDDERWTDRVRETDGEIAESLLRAIDDPLRLRVMRRGRGEHQRRVLDTERLGDETTRRERFDAAVASAPAARAFERHRQVADLPRRVRRAAQEPAIAHDRPTDARRDRDGDEVTSA